MPLLASVRPLSLYIQLRQCDLANLNPERWLNDEVINYFMAMLCNRAEGCGLAGGKVYLHSTMFYAKLVESNEGYCYECVRRWTRLKKNGRGDYGKH
jgi:sentrin-specific protease 1